MGMTRKCHNPSRQNNSHHLGKRHIIQTATQQQENTKSKATISLFFGAQLSTSSLFLSTQTLLSLEETFFLFGYINLLNVGSPDCEQLVRHNIILIDQNVSEYNQEIPQSHNADQPTAPDILYELSRNLN